MFGGVNLGINFIGFTLGVKKFRGMMEHCCQGWTNKHGFENGLR